MEHAQILPAILAELTENARRIDPAQLEAFCDVLLAARRVFVAGAGRSGFAARAFANRLMHLGLTAFFVGETTCPPIQAGDALVIGSGSGETGSLVVMAQKAHALGATLATLTIYPQATIGRLADAAVVIPGATPKSGLGDTLVSIQPMGSAFEQLSWLVYDACVMIIMDRRCISAEDMFSRHANLE